MGTVTAPGRTLVDSKLDFPTDYVSIFRRMGEIMQSIWRRPLTILFGIPMIAVIGWLGGYGFDFHGQPPTDGNVTTPIVGALFVLVFLWSADHYHPRGAEAGSDYLARRYDNMPLVFVVVIIACLAGTIFAPALENFAASGLSRFVQQHVQPLSMGLLAVTGIIWLTDTCTRRTQNRLEFTISRILTAALLGATVTGFFVIDRTNLIPDLSRLTAAQYAWVATGALATSLIMLRK